MQNSYSIRIWLDTRRKKANGKYPVKLRVFTSDPRKQKLYPIKDHEYSKTEFKEMWELEMGKYETKRDQLVSVEQKAKKVARKIDGFSFDLFEKKFLRKGSSKRINTHYDEVINNMQNRGSFGTMDTYRHSRASFQKFIEHSQEYNVRFEDLGFGDVNRAFLDAYERFMTNDGKKINTISIYTRCLRTIYNKAIREKDLKRSLYPFGKQNQGKYEIPSETNTKKALKNSELKALFEAKAQGPEQEKAKDFWFLSYNCNGMNIKDLAYLRNKDLGSEKFEFKRAKTKNTKKKGQRSITVPRNDYINKMFEKYSNTSDLPDVFVFDIISEKMTDIEKHRKIKSFTRFVNQHMKNLCASIGLDINISSYWARHSWATFVVRNKGASLEFAQEGLGHNNIKTTQDYFGGFEDETKKEIANALMNF